MKTSLYPLLLFSFFINSVNSQDCNDAIHTGEGTFYVGVAGGGEGNCSLPVALDDFLHCALNNFDYDGSAACGGCIRVSGTKGSVTLKVVDRCPECAEGDVDMTQEAFAMIAEVIDGRVPISWKFVPCPDDIINPSIKINFKEGSSAFWTAIQFRNTKHAITKMEYQKTDATWQSVNRELFNFFIEPSGIPSPMNLRITSVLGERLLFKNISLDLNNDYNTNTQFTTPESCQDQLSINRFNTITNKYYPNPTSEKIYIQNNYRTWTLTDTKGKIIDSGNTSTIDTSSLPNGYYFITIGQQVAKIIKN